MVHSSDIELFQLYQSLNKEKCKLLSEILCCSIIGEHTEVTFDMEELLQQKESIVKKFSETDINTEITDEEEQRLIDLYFNLQSAEDEIEKEIFNKKSEFTDSPLIDLDNIVLDDNLMHKLKNRFGTKISTVTGRGIFAFSYSMKNFLDAFDIQNSVFLEDRPLNLAKPNPESLVESISKINSKCSLYIGDSMEDLLMVQKCQEQGYDVSFCGIYGSSDEPELKYELFQKNNASIILESIRELPKALNLV